MASPKAFAPALVIFSGVTQYVGAGIAVGLFTLLPPLSVAWGRIACGALALLLWRRHLLRREGKIDWRAMGHAAAFGVVLGGMNLCFYMAISHIPLGTAVSLEYVGPVVLAALTGRGWRVRLGLILAGAGVLLISWVGVDLSAPTVALGVGMAVAAGALWAGYIVLGRRLASGANPVDSLAWGTALAALVYAPVSLPVLRAVIHDWHILFLLLSVGVLSSVIPYAVDQVVMRLLTSAAFALLSSLFPATSLLLGILMLHQIPNIAEVAGLIAISFAVLLATTSE